MTKQSESSVIWHDVECGAYRADLATWLELAADAEGAVLDLGCGTGRVGLHLARRGHEVLGVDSAPELVAAFNERPAELAARATVGDARELALERDFALAIAPMQLIQLLDGPGERVRCLEGIATHLRPGGVAALAIAEDVLEGAGEAERGVAPLPDTCEIDGRVYSSLPLATIAGADEIVIHRLRQTVSASGQLDEEESTIHLATLSADRLELEARSVGLAAAPRRYVPPTDEHVGSTVVVLRKEA